MNRAEFIKNILIAGGVSALPKEWIVTYDKFYLLQCFIAGFRYYEGMELLNDMKEGDMLELVREPENEYDANAIALHWNNRKVGFIPAMHNETIAKLLDAEALKMHVEITHLKHEAQAWENVAVAVYFLKERAPFETIPAGAQYLTMLETPRYYSVKRGHDQIQRIDIVGKKRNGTKGPIPTYIPDAGADENYGGAAKEFDLVNDELVVVNMEQLPAELNDLKEQYMFDESSLNNLFPEPKMRVIFKDEDVKRLMPYMKQVREVTDKVGNDYAEVVMEVTNIVEDLQALK
jgi:hypothetical protein